MPPLPPSLGQHTQTGHSQDTDPLGHLSNPPRPGQWTFCAANSPAPGCGTKTCCMGFNYPQLETVETLSHSSLKKVDFVFFSFTLKSGGRQGRVERCVSFEPFGDAASLCVALPCGASVPRHLLKIGHFSFSRPICIPASRREDH